VVAATASGQSHLDAAVYLEEKHLIQGLVLKDAGFMFFRGFFPLFFRNSKYSNRDCLFAKWYCIQYMHSRLKISSSYIKPLAEVCLHSSFSSHQMISWV